MQNPDNIKEANISANISTMLGVPVRDNYESHQDIDSGGHLKDKYNRHALDSGPNMALDSHSEPSLQGSPRGDLTNDITAIGKEQRHRGLHIGREQGKDDARIGLEAEAVASLSGQQVSVGHGFPRVFADDVTRPPFDPVKDITDQITSEQNQIQSSNLSSQMEPHSGSLSPSLGLLNTPKASKIKHKPVSPRGTKFLWNDNMQYHDLGNTPFKLNTPRHELLILRLKATTGTVYNYEFPEKNSPDWSSQTFITRANRWFHQIIIRHLDNDPANKKESTKRPSRSQWSLQEQNYLHDLIEQTLERSENGKLTEQDWDDITTKQNRRFVGDMMRIGQGFVDLHAAKKDNNSGGMRKGWGVTSTTNKAFVARPVGGCKAAIKYWPETKEMVTKGAEGAKARNHSTANKSQHLVDVYEEDNDGYEAQKKDRGMKRKPELFVSDDDESDNFGETKSPTERRSMAKKVKSVKYNNYNESANKLVDGQGL